MPGLSDPPLIGGGLCRVAAWGETADPAADWLSAFPGEIEAEVGWPKAPSDTPSLVALLSMADLRELDLRAGVETRFRWWAPGRLQIRAPREALFWRGLEDRFRDPRRVSARVRWLQGHRRHEAWREDRVAGLEMTDGRGYREWTLVAAELPPAELAPEIRKIAPSRLTAHVAHMRPKSLDLPREPARVRRWFLTWEGDGPLDRSRLPGLRPSWHYRLSHPLLYTGWPLLMEETHTHGRPAVLRVDGRVGEEGSSLPRGEVRVLSRMLPAGRSWWHPEPIPREPDGVYALWASRAEAYRAAQELGRPRLDRSRDGRIWWRRWPETDDGLWLVSHAAWPEQAFLARYPAVGPYDGRVEVRWGWHGPRFLYPAGAFRQDLQRLIHAQTALEDWWSQLYERAPNIL